MVKEPERRMQMVLPKRALCVSRFLTQQQPDRVTGRGRGARFKCSHRRTPDPWYRDVVRGYEGEGLLFSSVFKSHQVCSLQVTLRAPTVF